MTLLSNLGSSAGVTGTTGRSGIEPEAELTATEQLFATARSSSPFAAGAALHDLDRSTGNRAATDRLLGDAPPPAATKGAPAVALATTPAPVKVGPLIVTSQGGDPQKVADQLKLLPPDVQNLLAAKGVKFVAVKDSGTDFDSSLNGVVPRGWGGVKDAGGKQITWDNVPGQYDPKTNTVVLATSGKNSHGSWNFVLHETGHAVDASLGLRSAKADFQKAYAPTAGSYSPTNRTQVYYTQLGNPAGYLSETFAESFAGYYASRGTAPTPGWNSDNGVTNLNTARASLNTYWQNFTWLSAKPSHP